MAEKIGSKKLNRGWTSGLPMDSPLRGFRTVKISPWVVQIGPKKTSMYCVLEFLK